LEEDGVDIVVSANDGSYKIFLGESDVATFISLSLSGSIPSYSGIKKDMSKEEVLNILGNPSIIKEPKSQFIFGGERGTGAFIYDRSSYTIEVIISYATNKVWWVNLKSK